MSLPAPARRSSGVLLAARYGSGDMELGAGYDYTAIAAVLVGGTSIQGGSGSVVRTLIGVTVIAIIEVVLLLRGFSQQLQYLITGLHRARRHHAAHHRRAGDDARAAKLLLAPTARPFTIMAGAILVLALMDRGTGYFFSSARCSASCSCSRRSDWWRWGWGCRCWCASSTCRLPGSSGLPAASR